MESKHQERINQLAIPKGTVTYRKCEICYTGATTKCENCKVTHYCSEHHKTSDWESFHKDVCSDLVFLRSEHPILYSNAERKEQDRELKIKKMRIVQLAQEAAKKWIIAKVADYAYCSAMYAFNISEEVYGPEAIEVIYPSCLVSEAYLGLGRNSLANEYIMQAMWIARQHMIIPCHILAKLHRVNGINFMANNMWSEARRAFSENVYFLSEEYGASDIRVGVGYGYLGLAQMESQNLEGAFSFLHKMADPWLNHFLDQYIEMCLREPTERELEDDESVRELELQFQEVRSTIKLVYEALRHVEMTEETDKVVFKIYIVEYFGWMRSKNSCGGAVYREEALAAATRTKQDKAVPYCKMDNLKEALGADYILLWERKNIRPRTVATKYLERVKHLCKHWGQRPMPSFTPTNELNWK